MSSSSREKVNKELLNVINCIKDNITNDLNQAVRESKIVMDVKLLQQVTSLACQVVDAAYYRSNKSFMRSVDAAIAANVPAPVHKAPEKKA